MKVFPAVPVHGHWNPVIHAADRLQRSLAQVVGWPWGQGKDHDTVVGHLDIASVS